MLSYLQRNSFTEIGKLYQFSKIRDLDEYRNRVPLVKWDDIEMLIEKSARGVEKVLTSDKILFFHPTGGSTGGSKLIPFTKRLAKEFSRVVTVWLLDVAVSYPGTFCGKTIFPITPFSDPNISQFGKVKVRFLRDSEYIPIYLKKILSLSILPVKLDTNIARVEQLLEKDLSSMWLWHPTLFFALLENLFSADFSDRPVLQKKVRDLRNAFYKGDLSIFWPNLRFISCWGDGSAREASRKLKKLFKNSHLQPKGLMATEGVVSFPFSKAKGPIVAFFAHFIEFIDNNDNSYTLWEVQKGKKYKVALTTGGGLYRYMLGDWVEITDFWHKVPVIRFLARDNVVDLVGEKLEYSFVRNVIQRIKPKNVEIAFIRPSKSKIPKYKLYLYPSVCVDIDKLAAKLDEELKNNFSYKAAREIGQLAPPEVVFISKKEYLQIGLYGKYEYLYPT